MKRLLIAILIALVGLLAYLAFRPEPQQPDISVVNEKEPAPPKSGAKDPLPPVPKPAVPGTPPVKKGRPTSVTTATAGRNASKRELLDGLNEDGSSIKTDLRIVDSLFKNYYFSYQQLPFGTHEEIVQQLRGKNPKQIFYIPNEHPAVTEKGQLIDRWGSPFFFHQVSKSEIGVRSAGPDQTMWTQDDEMTKDKPVQPAWLKP